MHVGVIELLRCPADHAESALVASATRQLERRILDGTLGCPVCGAEYSIREAIADFRRNRGAEDIATNFDTADPPNEEAAIRLAAQLDLTQPGRLILLFGDYSRLAPMLSVMFDAACVAINVPRGEEEHIAEHASVLRIAETVPIAPSAAHGAAVDQPLRFEQLCERLRAGGRLVIPAGAVLPPGMTLLATDSRESVAVHTSEMISLRRASR